MAVSTGQQNFKNAFRSLPCLGYCWESNTEELDCVKTALFSRQVLSYALWTDVILLHLERRPYD